MQSKNPRSFAAGVLYIPTPLPKAQSQLLYSYTYDHHTSYEKRGGGGAQPLYSLNRTTSARAFTLIELLVVIAIIGILSAVVLASLSVARERGREASIRSTLKNMGAEIELLQESNGGNYNFVNNCQNAGHVLAKYVTALVAQGATVRCDSFSNTTDTTDVFARWGVTASLSGSTLPVKAWSVSPEGVVKWDESDSNSGAATNWNNASVACINQGKKLATAEQYRSLWRVTATHPHPGFVANVYWSSTEVPGVSANAYYVGMGSGGMGSVAKSVGGYVRCVQ